MKHKFVQPNGSIKLPENRHDEMKRRMQKKAEDTRSIAAKVGAAKKRIISWTPDQLKRALGPMVYIWWGQTEFPLYIGMSKHGLSRACSRQHHCTDVIRGATRVEFIPCESASEAALLEMEFIRTMKPQYNRSFNKFRD